MTLAYLHFLIHLTLYLKRLVETSMRFGIRNLDSDSTGIR